MFDTYKESDYEQAIMELFGGLDYQTRQCQEFCVIRMVDLTPFFQRKLFREP